MTWTAWSVTEVSVSIDPQMHPDTRCFHLIISSLQQIIRLKGLFIQLAPALSPTISGSEATAGRLSPSISCSDVGGCRASWGQVSMSHKVISQINEAELHACINLIQDVVELDQQDDDMLIKYES